MKLIIGTKNKAKVNHMRDLLTGLDIEIAGLMEQENPIEIAEDGKTAQENARKKAIGYSQVLKQPVLSIDNALYLEGLSKDKQPGINVRRISNKNERPTDQELLEYFSNLIKSMGEKINGHWEFAICLAIPNEKPKEITIISPRIFVSQPSKKILEGYPLDSIQIDPKTKKYISEMNQKEIQDFHQRTIDKPLSDFVKKSLGI